MNDEVTIIRCAAADEWLNAISPMTPRFRHSDPDQWIFRGQRDSMWKLLPTAFRKKSWRTVQAFHRRDIPWKRVTEKSQRIVEQNVIREFVRRADQAGLSIPEDSARVRQLLFNILEPENVSSQHDRLWPPPELWSVVALAQHYGVPTRLLDWTYSAWTAAYFAVVEPTLAPSRKKPAPDVGVWAYSVPLHDIRTHVGSARRAEGKIHLVTAPYAGNPNLAAQRGVHMLYLRVAPADRPAERPPLDRELCRIHREFTTEGEENALFLFTLPATEAARALRLLAKAGITAAALFPGYAGVVKAMREHRVINEEITRRVRARTAL
jgi:hypothetical protein